MKKPTKEDMERFRRAINCPKFGNAQRHNGFTYYDKYVDVDVAKEMYQWLKTLLEE